MLHAALAARARWQLSYRDTAIVEATRALGCHTLYSEDLRHRQDFGGVRMINPFV